MKIERWKESKEKGGREGKGEWGRGKGKWKKGKRGKGQG